MENALVGSKTFVLGLNIHCKGCEAKVKRRLVGIRGVHKVAIDSKKGHITITGTIDPPTLISILEKYSMKAVVVWEQPPPPKEDSISSRSTVNGDDSTNDQNIVRTTGGSKMIDQFEDSELLGAIRQLSGGRETEVTITKTVKFVFHDGNMKVVETTNSITSGKNEKVVVNNNNNNSVPGREEKTVMGTPYLGSGGGHHICCCQYPGHVHMHQNQGWASSSTASSAPPIQYAYSPVRPPIGYPPYQTAFSDDNVNGCVII